MEVTLIRKDYENAPPNWLAIKGDKAVGMIFTTNHPRTNHRYFWTSRTDGTFDSLADAAEALTGTCDYTITYQD